MRKRLLIRLSPKWGTRRVWLEVSAVSRMIVLTKSVMDETMKGGSSLGESLNPWVAVTRPQASPVATAETPADQEDDLSPVTGLAAPAPELVAPPAADQTYPRVAVDRGQLTFVGTHGGAGVTTLSRVFGLPESTRTWPVAEDGPTYVFLVCRSNVTGLRSAQLAAREWASGTVPGLNVLGLIVIADAPGRLPKDLRSFAQQIGGGVPRVWHIDWHQELRTSTDVSGLAQGPLRRFGRDLHLLQQEITN